MKDKVLNIILAGLVTYLIIYMVFFYKTGNETEVENPNFSLEIKINGLEDNKDYLWAFSSIEPGVGIVTVDFKTGKINPQTITKLKFKNGKLKIDGRIEEPGLYTLRNLKGKEELVFMLDTCDQCIESDAKDLIKDKYLFGYVPFIYSGSSLNKEYQNFWNHPKIKEFNNNYLFYMNWSREKIKELYGISLEEHRERIIKGQFKQILSKRISNKEKEFFKEKERRITELNKIKYKAVLQFIKENPNKRVCLDYLLCYVYMLGNEKPNYENMSQYMPLLGDQLHGSLCYQYLRENYELRSNLKIGQYAPDFTVKDQYGDSIRLSDLRGNIVLVEFWNSSCDHCADEKANMLEMYLKYQDKDFEIISVSFDTEREEWLVALEEQALPWLQYRDSIGYDMSNIIKEYAYVSIPYYYLIDKEGKIVAKALRQPKIATNNVNNLNFQLKKIFGT